MRYGVLIALLIFSLSSSADTFKCLAPSGEVVFSDSPCDKGEVIDKLRPNESVPDPDAAQREVERQKAVADRLATENEAAKSRKGGVAILPDYSSPPPKWPDPRPVSPSSTMGR